MPVHVVDFDGWLDVSHLEISDAIDPNAFRIVGAFGGQLVHLVANDDAAGHFFVGGAAHLETNVQDGRGGILSLICVRVKRREPFFAVVGGDGLDDLFDAHLAADYFLAVLHQFDEGVGVGVVDDE